MGSYYREHVSFPNVAAGPYPPHLISTLENVNTNVTDGHDDATRNNTEARECSVKGCSAMLPPGYPNKMCDDCRGRHRVYAMTKRAKRKMEKALLNNSTQNGQPVVWMPADEVQQGHSAQSPQPTAGPSRHYQASPPVSQMEDPNTQQFDDYSQTWDPRAIDPRLFSQTSELAGALTLPLTPQQSAQNVFTGNNRQPPHPPSGPSMVLPAAPPPPPSAPEIHPVLAEVLKAVPGLNLPTRITSGPTVPVSAPASSVDGPLPPRFCSIKGCKTLIAGNSFFKMCEPCRDRYRSYGTTKRAKWKREKEFAVAELHKGHAEEDDRPPEADGWPDCSPPTSAGPSNAPDPSATPEASAVDGAGDASETSGPPPPRMCTVSHCREILPGDYQFLRCERHRIQNRHHSKLKRERDKEVKAQVFDGWAAAVGARAVRSVSVEETGTEGVSFSVTDSGPVTAGDIALAFGDMDSELRDGSLDPDFAGLDGDEGQVPLELEETPLGEPSSGLPPAARGTRRTNHVCSIKACANLLSPSNPWKMCDLCRSRDRAGRRIKALRDSGLITPEVADGKIVEVRMEVEGREKEKEKGKGKGKGGKKGKGRKNEDGDGVEEVIIREGEENPLGSGADVQQQHRQPPPSEMTVSSESPAMTVPTGSIAPSAMHHTPPEVGHLPSMFNGVPVSDHSSLVFMEPMLGEIASSLEQHLAQVDGSQAIIPGVQSNVSQHVDPSVTSMSEDSPATAPIRVSSSPKKKQGRRVKSTSALRPNEDGKVDHAQSATDHQQPAAQTKQPESTTSASTLPVVISTTAEGTSPTHSTQPHPPPGQPPYPYYVPSYMTPYGAPPTYPYGYPPPPKGSFFPQPMYQTPYPYPYPYPGQSYPHPGPPYPPPTTTTPYSPPAQLPYSPPEQPQPQPQSSPVQSYTPSVQPYPYVSPFPHPPPSPSLQQPPQPQQQSQPTESPSHTISSSPKFKSPRPTTITTTAASPPDGNASSEPAQKPTTFIVRTSETYTNPMLHPSKAAFAVKRKRDDERGDASPNKRAEAEAAGTYSTFRISLSSAKTLAASPSDSYADNIQVWQMGNVEAAVQVAGVVEDGGVQQEAPAMVSCGNRTCKRMVAGGTSVTSGALCERCRGRLKKKQAKVKHRFKLEPKAILVGCPMTAGGKT